MVLMSCCATSTGGIPKCPLFAFLARCATDQTHRLFQSPDDPNTGSPDSSHPPSHRGCALCPRWSACLLLSTMLPLNKGQTRQFSLISSFAYKATKQMFLSSLAAATL